MDNQVELFEDVKIFNQNISADTIQINSGACEVDSQSDNPYVPYAIIPKNDWRELTEAEHDALVGTDKTLPASSSVGVINVPEETFIPLKREGFYNLTSESEITTFLKRGDLSAIYKPFYELFLNHLRKNDGVALTPFLTKPPNQVTVTVNIIDGVSRKVGIHVDTWDKLCMKDLSQARNRICINGGVEERYFLFYNITLNTISKILKKKGVKGIEQLYISHRLLNEFLKHVNNYPMVRIKVRPGQAYIAPTENIFHDGSTLGTSEVDRHMTCRGHFSLNGC